MARAEPSLIFQVFTMRRILCALVIASLLAGAGTAQAATFAFEQITVDATAGGVQLTAANIPVTFLSATCRLRTAEISVLTVGTSVATVTASVGQLLEPGDVLVITSRDDALNLRAIRTGATSGQLDCSYKSK